MRKDIESKSNEIVNLYSDNSISDIAKLMKCDYSVIKRILKENNFQVRPLNFYTKGRISPFRLNIDKEVISMYESDIPGTQIAKHFHCNISTIYDILNRNNIKIKGTKYFNLGKPSWNKGKHYTSEMRKKISEATKKTMTQEHRNELREIRLNKIKLGEFIGENHPNWLGGKSFEPYGIEFNKALKLAIKQRDGFLCIKCGMREEDALKLFQKRLNIHHINYNKLFSIPENCCALCVRCNAEVNFNRPHWTKFFQSLLSERYDYKYSETKDIILNFIGKENAN